MIKKSQDAIEEFLIQEKFTNYKFVVCDENWNPIYPYITTTRITRVNGFPGTILQFSTPRNIKESKFFVASVGFVGGWHPKPTVRFVYECEEFAYRDFIFYAKLLK